MNPELLSSAAFPGAPPSPRQKSERPSPHDSSRQGGVEHSPSQSEVLIIGGGLAGTAAAITLARAGRSVTLVEREPLPVHKVCGEFLSTEALTDLRTLGVDVSDLGAVPITRVRLASNAAAHAAPLPFTAMSLTRRNLDTVMLRTAELAGVNVLRGRGVEHHAPTSKGWQAQLRAGDPGNGDTLTAQHLMIATGKHDLRGEPRPEGKQNDLIAFKMYFRLQPAQQGALQSAVELLLYRGGYAGLQLVEDGIANLCCLIQRDRFTAIGKTWPNLLAAMQSDCPHLAARLKLAVPLLERPLAITGIPYGYVREQSADHAWHLGDQAAVIPSFTGDGMSIALHSGRLAAEMFLAGRTPEQYQRRLSRELRTQVRLSTWISQGMLHRPTRSAFELALRVWPGALRLIARQTRLSPAIS